MTAIDSYIIIGIGVFFIILGLIVTLWARGKARGYGDILSRREELRSFLGYWPESIDPGALKTGGLLFVVVGVAMMILGAVLLL